MKSSASTKISLNKSFKEILSFLAQCGSSDCSLQTYASLSNASTGQHNQGTACWVNKIIVIEKMSLPVFQLAQNKSFICIAHDKILPFHYFAFSLIVLIL